MCVALFKGGAQLNVKDLTQQTPLDIAVAGQYVTKCLCNREKKKVVIINNSFQKSGLCYVFPSCAACLGTGSRQST